MDSLNILVVDDEPAVAVVLEHAANQWGHQVTIVRSLADAREEIGSEPRFDLVLLDVGLPDGSGIELLRELRGQPAFADWPVIILTGAGDSETIAQGRDLRAHVITKPFSPTKLGALIAEVVPDKGGNT